jgi:DNA-binding XRE family transcriptional regulator
LDQQRRSILEKQENMKTFTLEQVQDKLIGEIGTPKRDSFENELRLDLLGNAIRQIRRERNLTQEELGRLVGVQKAQISKLENNAGNVTIDTLMRVFAALKAKVKLHIELADLNISIG